MNRIKETLLKELKAAASDEKYRIMQTKIIPTVDAENIIGVRVPEIRKTAAKYRNEDAAAFLDELPHRYLEEYYLHAFLLSGMKDYEECMRRTELLLPYIDNWAVCDSFAPKVFAKHKPELPDKIKQWHASGHTYTIRFGTGCLMRWFLDGDFKPEYLEMAASVRSEEYYVNMMTAWYFATALAKQYDSTLPYLTERRLDKWTHNKTIQKAIESFRVSEERKEFLKKLKD